MNLVRRYIARATRPTLQEPQGIVVHAMGAFIGGKPAWEFLRDIGVDAHRLIHPDGTVVDAIPSHLQAWHAGKSRMSSVQGLNRSALGVELLVAGDHTFDSFVRALRDARQPAFTAEAYAALVACCADWLRSYPSITWVLGHEHVSGPWVRDDPKPDPGPWIEWPRLWQDLFGQVPTMRAA